jgi:hypothetical protein
MRSGERSLGELFTDLTHTLRSLMRQELALARAELTQSVTSARQGAILVGIGIALAAAGGLALTAAACLGLVALGLPPAAAALVVAAVLLVAGLVFVRLGATRLGPDRMAPRATVETMRENAQLLRGQLR